MKKKGKRMTIKIINRDMFALRRALRKEDAPTIDAKTLEALHEFFPEGRHFAALMKEPRILNSLCMPEFADFSREIAEIRRSNRRVEPGDYVERVVSDLRLRGQEAGLFNRDIKVRATRIKGETREEYNSRGRDLQAAVLQYVEMVKKPAMELIKHILEANGAIYRGMHFKSEEECRKYVEKARLVGIEPAPWSYVGDMAFSVFPEVSKHFAFNDGRDRAPFGCLFIIDSKKLSLDIPSRGDTRFIGEVRSSHIPPESIVEVKFYTPEMPYSNII